MTDKNSVADWSTTASDNDNVGGVELAENKMRPKDVNNAIRTVMAQVKTANTFWQGFDTVADLIADETLTYSNVAEGDIVEAQGFRYEVAADDATDEHLETAGGVKLYVLAAQDGALTPEQFGAVGDGTTDDSTALQAALGTGFLIRLGKKTYSYGTGLVIPKSGHSAIIGSINPRSVLKYTGDGTALSWDLTLPNTVRSPVLRDFMLDCSDSTATCGLDFSYDENANGFTWGDVRNLYIYGAAVEDSVGLKVNGTFYTTFANIVSRNWSTNFYLGADGGHPSSANLFMQCVSIEGAVHGFHAVGSVWGYTFIRCTCEGDGQWGWLVEGLTSGTFGERHVLINCSTEDDYTEADFEFKNCRNVTVIGGGPGTNTVGDGIKLTNTRMSSFTGITLSQSNATDGYYPLVVDADSNYNVIQGYSRDTRQQDALSIANTRNDIQFYYGTGGATGPKQLGNPIAKVVKTLTTTATVDPRDNGVYLLDASAGAFTVTINSITYQSDGVELEFHKKPGDTNTITIDPSGSQTVGGQSTLEILGEDEHVVLRADLALGGWRIVSQWSPGNYNAVSSAATITLPLRAEVVSVPGTTNITNITATSKDRGRRVTLIFRGILTVTDGGNIRLASDFTTSSSATLALVCDGTNWYEVARSTN